MSFEQARTIEFQSAPGFLAGRYLHRLIILGAVVSFNPLPAF